MVITHIVLCITKMTKYFETNVYLTRKKVNIFTPNHISKTILCSDNIPTLCIKLIHNYQVLKEVKKLLTF